MDGRKAVDLYNSVWNRDINIHVAKTRWCWQPQSRGAKGLTSLEVVYNKSKFCLSLVHLPGQPYSKTLICYNFRNMLVEGAFSWYGEVPTEIVRFV